MIYRASNYARMSEEERDRDMALYLAQNSHTESIRRRNADRVNAIDLRRARMGAN